MIYHIFLFRNSYGNIVEIGVVQNHDINSAICIANYHLDDNGYEDFTYESYDDIGDLNGYRRHVEDFTGCSSVWLV